MWLERLDVLSGDELQADVLLGLGDSGTLYALVVRYDANVEHYHDPQERAISAKEASEYVVDEDDDEAQECWCEEGGSLLDIVILATIAADAHWQNIWSSGWMDPDWVDDLVKQLRSVEPDAMAEIYNSLRMEELL